MGASSLTAFCLFGIWICAPAVAFAFPRQDLPCPLWLSCVCGLAGSALGTCHFFILFFLSLLALVSFLPACPCLSTYRCFLFACFLYPQLLSESMLCAMEVTVLVTLYRSSVSSREKKNQERAHTFEIKALWKLCFCATGSKLLLRLNLRIVLRTTNARCSDKP